MAEISDEELTQIKTDLENAKLSITDLTNKLSEANTLIKNKPIEEKPKTVKDTVAKYFGGKK